MINFQPIELEDKERVQKYTLCSKRRNCDLSFTNLYSWRFLYQTEIAEMDGFLLFRFYIEGEQVYMMPVGTGNVAPVIEALIEDARAEGVPFRLLGVCVNMRAELEAAFPDRFTFTSDRDYADYVYLRSDLATLRGKKYQPKRNHINKFKASYPDYEYKPLTPELIPECLRLESLWCKANDCAENEALQAERRSMTAALEHMNELDLMGGVLHVNGEIAAFTFGAPINDETFDTCVEKANTDIEGSYTMINYEFANHIPEQYIYINREEDLGLEGLRKAKLSYHPETILEKYIVELR
ncbi:DUF2156 domain-containing protein [uncultured Bacteroides sp.]|uniref:DUF2156 domain-containing protein n=1 Tax=uncultured Bacteroides sp. TaxID=162156 RepID=UPI00261124D3|nr:DUF2156 domain-containing protein [uncultured Bacteroides sp.]